MIHELILVKQQHNFNCKHANKFPTVHKYPRCECVTWTQLINRLILGKEGKNYKKNCSLEKGWGGGATVSQMAVRMK